MIQNLIENVYEKASTIKVSQAGLSAIKVVFAETPLKSSIGEVDVTNAHSIMFYIS